MKALACAFTLATLAAYPTQAMDRSLVRQFEKLDPQTRLEQRCDTEAMERIGADKNRFEPDKVIAYTFADPVMKGDKMKATGAVFRSKGDWYKVGAEKPLNALELGIPICYEVLETAGNRR
ncbi:DUF930 domain-containing protein [Sinorhizobium medicae]|uniref:DUF930 domain-containing protein n=1 Tax=Sinorhizobium medicae TaxID=110321 RepID=UPI002D7853E9|nr:DUF930 domain-containing protein [Sinorhizobium medicae]